jgi:glutamate-1-semialdehyde 2,1-aminomutase
VSSSSEYITTAGNHIVTSQHYNFRQPWLPNGIVFAKGEGAELLDIDGVRYIDLFQNFGSNILGHGNRAYNEGLQNALLEASTMPFSNLSIRAALLVKLFFPSMERLRFCVTGTEAVQMAIRLSRAQTGKQMILRFGGHYHGHADSTLCSSIEPGYPPVPSRDPADPRYTDGLALGIPQTNTFLLEWNNPEQFSAVFSDFHHKIACVILEPWPINHGAIPPRPGFLKTIRDVCSAHNVVLIFDEIITGFRIPGGSAQLEFGVLPDITVLGKCLGGGSLPISALGGSKEIMLPIEKFEVIHAGTFNGYHLGLAAIIANLEQLIYTNALSPGSDYLRKCKELKEGVLHAAASRNIPLLAMGPDTCPYFHFAKLPLRRGTDFNYELKMRAALFQKLMLDARVLCAPLLRFYPPISLQPSVIDSVSTAVGEVFAKLTWEERVLLSGID